MRWHAKRAALVYGLAIVQAAAMDLHVAPGGDDANPGTADRPLRTPAAAQQAARKQAGREPVNVWFASGTYYLSDTLRFAAEDSGAAQAPVAYAAAPGAKPVLSGGLKLELSWESHKDGIFKAKTPPGLSIDQLFVDGVRQRMARYPNYEENTRPYNGFAADAFSPERATRWADPAGGFIHAMHRAHWGGYHYRITGKNEKGEVTYEGGWQNNRQMGMHPQHRFVENIFEELDAPMEWFHDAKTSTLYYKPPAGMDLKTAAVEVVRLRHLVEFNGSRGNPVRFVTLKGFVFRHAARTFMDVKEPLLRSDWTIYRGGAVLFYGAEDCAVTDSEFDQLGGNAVFVNNYNRRVRIAGCHIHDTGASAVAFVGNPSAVRNPLFEYNQRQDVADIDRTPGPKTDDYPADCVVEDCLIRRVGVVEKQATGVQISMSMGITLRHCTICEASRAGINISEGTFGGHVIEFCDVFDTVRETGDHGSFNSWGRDRFWGLKNAPAAELPDLALLDVVKPNVIRNSRWRCDHGWDVDLDDGSSNYEICNNLFLNGGLKLREGFHRRVWNNIAVNNSLHPHVWYDNSGDVVTNNIWMGAYRPAGGMPKGKWGREIDRNLFTADADRLKFAAHGCDANSIVGDPMFVDPAKGDYRVKDGSPSLKLGFVNFPMDRFGVQKPELKALAPTPVLPAVAKPGERRSGAAPNLPETVCWQGATVWELEGEEFSAYGVSRESGGVVLKSVPTRSVLASAGLRAEDLVQGLNGKPVRTVADLLRETDRAGGAGLRVAYVRGQASLEAPLREYVFAESWSGGRDEAAKRLANASPTRPVLAAAARPVTKNESVSSLHDGKLGENYGPVFENGTAAGLYKIDLGSEGPVGGVCTWSYNQNGNRGAQRFTLYGSAAGTDPGWDVANPSAFRPIATVVADCKGEVLETRIRTTVDAAAGLGSFRWLVWAVRPVTKIGENTSFQEFRAVPPEAAR